MRSRAHRPTTRLLLVPAAILTAVVAVTVVVPGLTVRSPDPAARLTDLPATVEAVDGPCERERITADAPADPTGAAVGSAGSPQVDRLPVVTGGRRVTSGQLIGCPTVFDGRLVSYVGELVGDLLPRDGGSWVLVNDDDYALVHGPLPSHREHAGINSGLSVWLPDELTDEVTGLGRPGRRGDVVEVHGQVLRADPDDGGGLTIRAQRLTVLRASQEVGDPVDLPQAVLAAAAVVAAGGLWTVRRRARR